MTVPNKRLHIPIIITLKVEPYFQRNRFNAEHDLFPESFRFLHALLAAHVEEVVLWFQVRKQGEGEHVWLLLVLALAQLGLNHDLIKEEELSLVHILVGKE